MNNGMIIGQVFLEGRPAPDVWVSIEYIEGTSELNTGRGIQGVPRGIIINTPHTVADLIGFNIPIDPEGIAGQAIDIAALWRDVGVSVPCPLVGRSIIETRMFIGYWVFSMSDR